MSAPQPTYPVREIDPSALDYSMFSHEDLANIVLQRSEVLHDEVRPGDIIRDWEAGDASRLNAAVEARGIIFAQRAVRGIQTEFEKLKPILDRLAPEKIADIGCGYAFFDLFAQARYDSELLLIDIEQAEYRHFGFEDEAAAYTNLTSAREFLESNGVPAAQITTWNPDREDMRDDEKPDLCVSFLACGFHFPVDMYMPFFRFGIEPGGTILLDLRAHNFQDSKRTLARLGAVEEIDRIKNRRRIRIRKGRR